MGATKVNRRARRYSVCAAAVVCTMLLPLNDTLCHAQEDGALSSPSAPLAERIAQLISELGSPDFAARERATTQLIEIGAPAYAQLREAYRASDDLEVRTRIRRAVTEIFLYERVYSRNGFLGVSMHTTFFPTHRDFPQIPAGIAAVRVETVQPGTAAEEAGLEPGDILFAIDGEPFARSDEPSASEQLAERIRTLGPGTAITLSILRGDRVEHLDATLGSRPRRYYQAQDDLERLEAARAALTEWWAREFDAAQDAGASSSPPSQPRLGR